MPRFKASDSNIIFLTKPAMTSQSQAETEGMFDGLECLYEDEPLVLVPLESQSEDGHSQKPDRLTVFDW